MNKVENAWYGIMCSRWRVISRLARERVLRRALTAVLLRHGAVVHGCRDFHDMATITERRSPSVLATDFLLTSTAEQPHLGHTQRSTQTQPAYSLMTKIIA